MPLRKVPRALLKRRTKLYLNSCVFNTKRAAEQRITYEAHTASLGQERSCQKQVRVEPEGGMSRAVPNASI